MAHIRGVEVGRVLLTPGDVMEHCYPEMDKRWKEGIGAKAPAAPAARPEIAPPPPTPPATPKSKSKKAKAESKVEAEVESKPESEDPSERTTEPGPESEQGSGYDPFK